MRIPTLNLPALPWCRSAAGQRAGRVAAAAALAAALLPGCIVVPAHHGYAAPVGVAYVAPTYAIPAPGYAWAYHGQHGWGWRHPQMGWHRGWR